MSPVDNADSSIHWVQNGILGEWVLLYRKILSTFVISEPDMNHRYLLFGMARIQRGMQDQAVSTIVENEVVVNESQWLTRPDAGIIR
jgi:hypothetical protein